MELFSQIHITSLYYIVASIVAGKLLHWMWSKRHINHFFNNLPRSYKRMSLKWTFEVLKYKDNFCNLITIVFDQYGGNNLCGWFGPVPLYITTDLEVVEKVCVLPELQNKSILYTPMMKLLDGGLVFISDKRWQLHRKALNPSFHNALFSRFIQKFNDSKHLGISEIRQLADGSDKKLDDLMIYLTMSTTLDASLDVSLPKEEVYDMSQSLSLVIKEFMWRVVVEEFNLQFVDIFDGKFRKLLKKIRTAVQKIVEEKKSEYSTTMAMERNPDSSESIRKDPKILLHQCLELHRTKEFTIEDVITETTMVMAASFDTTGITMFSVLVMLAIHPEVQERAFEEISSVFPTKDFHMEYEDIKQLPYLDMIIKETMRLCPAIVHIARDIRTDIALNKEVTLPKGLQILIPIFQLHRRKDIWGADANEFNPDRFLPENVANLHRYAYIPFSKGARNCIGWRYAELMMAIVLSGLIRNFRFETDVKYEELEFRSGIAIKYKNPPLMRIYPRTR